jgi:amino acid adenylation domain-containing protein
MDHRDLRPKESAMDAKPLPALFTRQAALTPDAPAIIDSRGTAISYADLDTRSDRIARALLDAGVTPESLVAVGLPRSPDLIATLLAVWKCGAAYVPLDPGHPADRMRWLLTDTGARFLVADAACAEKAAGSGVLMLFPAEIDGRGAVPATQPTLPAGVPAPCMAAYTIYTSGSTGRPKGVVISHEAIANRIMWAVREQELGRGDRVIQRTALTFDAAGWEIFAPLVSGGAVVLPAAGAEHDPTLLLDAVARFGVTVLQAVPSVLRLTVDEPGWTDCGALRLIASAGEPLDAELCRLLHKRSSAQIWNTYGPTECAIDVTAYRVDVARLSGRVPIGKPIVNVRVLVLDERGQPAPIGIPGELCVGGVALARGYLGQPALTAERFVPDPYGPPGSRIYRTGDLVRWRHDGTLDYLSRLDDQVKVNGVRIEPGEVETALLSHPAVRGAIVMARALNDGTNRLAAYVLSRETEISPDMLRRHLQTKLPGLLIPSAFVVMAEFPMLTNGKVNRAALPDPYSSERPSHVGPRTSAERVVAELWSELLKVDDLGAEDDFFQLGGSSLLLTRLASRLASVAGHEVAVQDLFTESTVAAQARLIDRSGQFVPPLLAVPRDGPLPLSFQQNQMWFLDQMNPGNTEWVTPMGVRLPGQLPVETVHAALEALVARHEILRTLYTHKGGEPRQVIDEPGPVSLRVADAGMTDGQLDSLIRAEFEQGFDLARGPVWRALLVPDSEAGHMLMLAVHHIASDGWSSAVFADDVSELCDAIKAGREPDLRSLPVQYADYAVWQRQWLTDQVLEPHLDFWRQELRGMSPLELPTDRPRPAVRDSRGAIVTFAVPGDAADGIAKLGQEHGATAFMTYLTVFAALLADASGQWDVSIGAPVAGRTRPEVGGLIGAFLNMLVLRCRLSPDARFDDLLDGVARTSRAAFAHQDLPFERLVEMLAPARDLSRTPLYQVMFNYLAEGETMGRDSLGPYAAIWRTARTDLTLYLYEAADGGMTGMFEYATSLFDELTIARLAERLVRMLVAVAADPSVTPTAVAAGADEPQGEVERRITAIWAAVLGREPGADQNFFQCGGNSRLALQVMADIQDEFDLELPVRLIFERPTVARLSAAVAELMEVQ